MIVPRPELMQAGPLTSDERLTVLQAGKPRWTLLSSIAALAAKMVPMGGVTSGHGPPDGTTMGTVYIDADTGDLYQKGTS